MEPIQAIRNRILQLCEQWGFTINHLADLAGMPPSSLKNILHGKSQNPKMLTIKMLCDGLGIPLSAFFDTEEFNALEQEIRSFFSPFLLFNRTKVFARLRSFIPTAVPPKKDCFTQSFFHTEANRPRFFTH